jgi:hypothetical protein
METKFIKNSCRHRRAGKGYLRFLCFIGLTIALPLGAQTSPEETTVVPTGVATDAMATQANASEAVGSEATATDGDGLSAEIIESDEEQFFEGTSWLDEGHGLVTDRADDLTQWFDAYFGGGDAGDTEAYSRLRLRVSNEWDERLGNDVRFRLGGKVNLPQISKRLDLVFQGDDPLNDINGEQDESQSRVALELKVNRFEDSDVDFKLTMGFGSNGPKPGIKFTYQRDLSERNSLRFIERVQFDAGDGTTSTSRLLFDHQIDDQQLIRSYSRALYGTSTDGLELSTSLQWINFWNADPAKGGPTERGIMAYGEVWGATEPYDYVSNYKLGVRYRRQTYRDYLFIEFEPSYNWRVDEPYDRREGAWEVVLRFEFLLFQDLRKDRTDS